MPRLPLASRLRQHLVWLIIVGLLAWSFAPTEMYKAVNIVTDWRNMAEFASGFLRPNFHDGEDYLKDMIETVQIAVWGTALAVLVGAPWGFCARPTSRRSWSSSPCAG